MFKIVINLTLALVFVAFGFYLLRVAAPAFAEEENVFRLLCQHGEKTMAKVQDEYIENVLETVSLRDGNRTSSTYELTYVYEVGGKVYQVKYESPELPTDTVAMMTYYVEDPSVARPSENACLDAAIKRNGLPGATKFIGVLMLLAALPVTWKAIKGMRA